MDIAYIEREKKITMCLMSSVSARVSCLNSQKCYRYLLNHPDTDIVKLIKTVHKAANHMPIPWHKDIIKDIINVMLSVCCRDEQYVQILSRALSNMYDRDINIKCYKKFGKIDRTVIKILMKVTHKLLKQSQYSVDEVHGVLDNSANGAIRFMHTEIKEALADTLDEKECDKIMPLLNILLYVVYQDTAYRDPFFWILNKIARPEIRAAIKPYVKPPKQWYANIWVSSRKVTADYRKSGKLPPYEHSVVERRMIPAKQIYDLSKL